jgi:capsular exopolysaccharide synthesis family protein
MSHDYQLAQTTPATADFWTQGGSAMLAPPTPSAPAQSIGGHPSKLSPLTKAHRLLRGRYPLAITLAAVGAVAGAVGGFVVVAPRYAATGMVLLDPRVIMPASVNDQNMNNYMMILQNQEGLLKSFTVAEDAMGNKAYVDAYRAAYPGQQLPDDQTFSNNIIVDHTRGASLLTVSFADKSKAVAEAAATASLKAYQDRYGSDDAVRQTDSKIKVDEQRLDRMSSDLAAKRAQLSAVIKEFGDPDAVTSRETFLETHALNGENELKALQQQFQEAKDMAGNGPHGPEDNEIPYQEIKATNDREMAQYLDARYLAQLHLEQVKSQGVLQSNPKYQEAVQSLDQARQRVDDYAHLFVRAHPGVIATPLTGTGSKLTSLDLMKSRMDQMQQTVDGLKAEATHLATVKQQMDDLKTDIANLITQQTTLVNTVETLRDTQLLTKTVMISMPGEATLQNDRRKAVAGVGFLFGAAFPVALLMLYGMKDLRFRYSDETTEADLAGVALLGILPNLPDRLSDPQQAGIAAHCVHQIRTMLQISRSNDEPQVLAITSASTGDGKTSLTLALGLSYAACGARTLLIDCDLLAAGLTHRLNVNSPDGILEAVANRALLEYVRTTDIADVAILPVGTTHAHHASTLSPVALRRLLSEAKKQFDIVIVDTGPILASIEASLICAAADRTILAVARNQQRPLVERSIGHLQAIGASLAGVVFNRAQAKDFEKSMSGLALRSRPTPGNPAAPGAANGASVAKAVAGSFKRAG